MPADTPTSLDGWLDTKGRMDDDEPATPQEVAALKSFLHDDLDTTSAAKAIMAPDESMTPLDGKDNRVAYLLLDTAMQFPSLQDRLLSLVDGIQELSETDLGLSDAQKQQYPQWQSWIRFERFWDLVDERRRSTWANRCTPDEDDTTPTECHARWANMNAFMARHFMRHKTPHEWPLFGFSVIREALEQESWKHPKPGPWPRTLAILDAEVPAAVEWLTIAGRAVYDLVDRPEQTHKIQPSDLWSRDEAGLSRDRWDFWKERLVWCQGQSELSDPTKLAAKRAVEEMVRIETGH